MSLDIHLLEGRIELFRLHIFKEIVIVIERRAGYHSDVSLVALKDYSSDALDVSG